MALWVCSELVYTQCRIALPMVFARLWAGTLAARVLVEYLAHLRQKVVEVEGLLQEERSGIKHPLVTQDIIGVSGYVKDLDVRPRFGNEFGEPSPAYVWHHYISDQHMNVASVLPGKRQRLCTVLGRQYCIAVVVKNHLQHVAHRVVILGQQNSLGALWQLRLGQGGRLRSDHSLDVRQIDLETGPGAWVATHANVAVALGHDAVYRRQSQPSAMPLGLRSKEWLEDMALGFGIHAAAGVTDDHQGVLSRRGSQVAGEVFIYLNVAGFDDQVPTPGHGVARVHREVHKHLFNLTWISSHKAQRGTGYAHHLDVFTDQPPEHAVEVSYHLVEIDDARLQDLTAAESQELSYESRRPLTCPLDLSNVAPQCRRDLRIGEREVTATQHRHQQIIEVMGHAASQSPDALEFVCMAELRLERLALGDVADHQLHSAVFQL